MRYSKVYSHIIRNPLIGIYAKGVYSLLKSFTSEKDNRAWPSIPTIAAALNIGQRTTRYALAELQYWGIISWTKGYSGKSNTYFLQDQIAASRIAKGDCPVVPYDPCPVVPPKYTHCNAACHESPAEYHALDRKQSRC